MPLPTKDPVAFRGVPSLGAEKKKALTMTFTQKQVEAMFARQATLREQGSSQCPLEIDFDDNKIYIGDIATPFSRFKEDGTREICQRSPTVSKPLAAISLSGNVIGKLNIQRDFDQDVADNVRKATEAENAKRNERTIVRLENPPVVGKKGRSGTGASALAKKAMSNRTASAQAAVSRPPASSPASRPSTPVAASSTTTRPTPPSSSARPAPPSSSTRPPARPPTPSSSTMPKSSSSVPTEPDLTSLRARLTHHLALDPRTTQEVLLEVGGRNPSPEIVREIEDTLTAVADEILPSKKGERGPVKWELRPRSWELVRPYEWPSLTPEQRTKIARKGRLACGQMGLPQTEPLWEHFKTRVSDISVAPLPSSKGKAKPPQPVIKKSEFKGGMFPKEKKPSTKGGGVASGGVTKTKAPTTKTKGKKEQEDEVEAKARKVVAGLVTDAKGKGKAAASSGTTAKMPKVKRQEEEEAPSPSTKARPPGNVKKEPSPLPPKPSRVQEHGGPSKRKPVDADTDAGSEMEEGELPVKPEPKRRKVNPAAEVDKPRVPSKQTERREAPAKKAGKEKDKVHIKEESAPPRQVKDGSAAPRASAGVSFSPSKVAPGGNKPRLEKEKEREREEREMERLKERERDKRRSTGKRGRRATPSFSSDEEEEEEEKRPLASSRVAPASKPKQPVHPPSSSKPVIPIPKLAPAPPSRAPAPSPALPTDKDALRRRYHTCYARYMGVTSKVHEQRAKIEDALDAADGDSVSADDMDLMDAEQLMQLRGEHERLRDELERIQHAHAMVF